MEHNTVTCILLLYSAIQLLSAEEAYIIVPYGHSPIGMEKVIIPAAPSGFQPPFPCVVTGMGTYEHGQTFTKGHFHYKCSNGTAEVIACVADDKSVIHIGRMFIRGGIRHKCEVSGDTVTYEQESTCYDHGIHYEVGEHFRNGSFSLVCQNDGIVIEGCYARNTDITIPVGSQRVIDHYLHKCEMLEQGRVRYTAHLNGCKQDNKFFNENQIWKSGHIRYQCTSDGIVRVLGCVDDNGLFVELGRDILIYNVVYRCYRVDRTTVYHRFECVGRTLAECILMAPMPNAPAVS
ncbi:unnamed protein product [Thelazia callipaeda]|uniref:Beta_helix domain-containing protein n=1 Tax=Thelazia callipaeda TaxID=103827 RepID=A0A0N5D3I3_THECL|nr:unnamed protein product [Thelazia callipaeda]